MEKDDRISELPDCTKEVFGTCLLSEIDLVYKKGWDKDKISSFMDLVSNKLDMCSETHLNKFAVDFILYQCFADKVDAWVDFAIKNKVEHIKLICRGDYYLVPETLYSHSSLTSLSLRRCDIASRAPIKWKRLKSLSLNDMRLSHCVMEDIFSSCPALEVLSLSDCWGPGGILKGVCVTKPHQVNDYSRLKNVEITNFILDGTAEPLLTLVELLLKKAKLLEKMVISVDRSKSRVSSTDLIKISDKLRSFPRALSEAIVEFDI